MSDYRGAPRPKITPDDIMPDECKPKPADLDADVQPKPWLYVPRRRRMTQGLN
jgi:hypothetical protein